MCKIVIIYIYYIYLPLLLVCYSIRVSASISVLSIQNANTDYNNPFTVYCLKAMVLFKYCTSLATTQCYCCLQSPLGRYCSEPLSLLFTITIGLVLLGPLLLLFTITIGPVLLRTIVITVYNHHWTGIAQIHCHNCLQFLVEHSYYCLQCLYYKYYTFHINYEYNNMTLG